MGWKVLDESGEVGEVAAAMVLLRARRSVSKRRRSPSNDVCADFKEAMVRFGVGSQSGDSPAAP